MLVFVKIGGSLITDKTQEAVFRAERMAEIARAIAEARLADPSLQLLLGHGSGSFGHVTASRYGTIQGVNSPEEWGGFAAVARSAAELNRLVAGALGTAGVPAWSLQPS
ncbi:MAG: uridylate kinase, partial [Anaerolineae bacterium]|nr:uridylate kinase [Anaerolineae bacterium]